MSTSTCTEKETDFIIPPWWSCHCCALQATDTCVCVFVCVSFALWSVYRNRNVCANFKGQSWWLCVVHVHQCILQYCKNGNFRYTNFHLLKTRYVQFLLMSRLIILICVCVIFKFSRCKFCYLFHWQKLELSQYMYMHFRFCNCTVQCLQLSNVQLCVGLRRLFRNNFKNNRCCWELE